MSNVEWGGATVFPVVNGYIRPEKGSAAFWYNLYASGEGMIVKRVLLD
jgi:prolyl 4-hydroxylase